MIQKRTLQNIIMSDLVPPKICLRPLESFMIFANLQAELDSLYQGSFLPAQLHYGMTFSLIQQVRPPFKWKLQQQQQKNDIPLYFPHGNRLANISHTQLRLGYFRLNSHLSCFNIVQ